MSNHTLFEINLLILILALEYVLVIVSGSIKAKWDTIIIKLKNVMFDAIKIEVWSNVPSVSLDQAKKCSKPAIKTIRTCKA